MNSNFVHLKIQLDAAQANKVVHLALAHWPKLAELRRAGQLQSINAGGQLRLAAVRGGMMPADVTDAGLARLADTVLTT